MKVSKQFLRDFAYIANRYGWTPEDIQDIKAQTRTDPISMARYWKNLAAAHRAGYEQTSSNGFMRLQSWCKKQGFPDPFTEDEWKPKKTESCTNDELKKQKKTGSEGGRHES